MALTSLMQDTNGIELDEINTCECTYQVLPESTFFMRALSYSMKCQFWFLTHYFILIVDPFSSRVIAYLQDYRYTFFVSFWAFPFQLVTYFVTWKAYWYFLWATSVSALKGNCRTGVLTECWLLLQNLAGECKNLSACPSVSIPYQPLSFIRHAHSVTASLVSPDLQRSAMTRW